MPLLALVALAPNEHYRRALAGGPERRRVRLFTACLVVLAACATPLRLQERGEHPLCPRAEAVRGAGPGTDCRPPLADLLVVRADGVSNERYAAKLNEGFALLRANTAPLDRIACLNFENPFSFGLQRPPPIGDVSSWHFGFGFVRARHCPPADLP